MKKWLVPGGLFLVLIVAFWVRSGPTPSIQPRITPTVVDRNGVVLYEPLSEGGTRSRWIGHVPKNVALATVAAEDHRFEQHFGIDAIAVVRAMLHDIRHMRVVEGGSTITQQVAKLIEPSPRTMRAKIREAIVALRLEHRYSKDHILALYCNLAPYGEQTAGIARASERYFGCAPEQLTVAQAAYLAALPRRPGTPRRALLRQRLILNRMRALGMIGDDEFRIARAEHLSFDRGRHPLLAPHFVEHVLGGSLPSAAIVRTTLDASLQREVRGIIAAQKNNLLRHGAHSVAVAVLDNRTGEWLAWEGSGDYFGQSFGGAIDGVTTPRQPGSTLKPFTYALAFEDGFTPATVIADVPSHFATAEEGVVYRPRNYDGRFRGPLRARAALAGSENVPAVAVLAKIGPPSLLRFLRRAGFSDLTHTADYYGVGLTLGDAEVTLEQLVTAYAIFARDGIAVRTRMLLDDRQPQRQRGTVIPSRADGEESPTFQPNRAGDSSRSTALGMTARRLFSRRTAFWITDILSDKHAREYAFGSGGSLDFPFPVAAKTGTSQAYHDNWTVGYTREVTVGVWVGNFDRDTLRNSSGITGAAPIFHDVMLAAVKRVGGGGGTIVDRPADLESQPICALSGKRPSIFCPAIETEWLPSDAPVEFCAWHHPGRVVLPAEYRAWEPAVEQAVATRREPRGLRILNPPNGTTYLVDPTLRSEFQALRLKATATVAWSVDGAPVGVEWPLRGGRHTITAVDSAGRRDSVQITVR